MPDDFLGIADSVNILEGEKNYVIRPVAIGDTKSIARFLQHEAETSCEAEVIAVSQGNVGNHFGVEKKAVEDEKFCWKSEISPNFLSLKSGSLKESSKAVNVKL